MRPPSCNRPGKRIMPYAFSLLFTLPGFVLCMLAFGEVDVAAGNEVLVELRRLVEQGDADAQYSLGAMYAHGRGVPEDDAEAVKWLRMAAEQGVAKAQFNLGVMYHLGEGVPEDVVEAVKWYRMAAEQGDADAQSELGFMYANGRGVPEDDAEAVKWYRMAAEQGNADAQYNLGVMYDIRRGRARRLCAGLCLVQSSCCAGTRTRRQGKGKPSRAHDPRANCAGAGTQQYLLSAREGGSGSPDRLTGCRLPALLSGE